MSLYAFSLVVLFWIGTLLVLQPFALYPVELHLANLASSREQSRTEAQPSVTLVVAAYNEEDVIQRKIENSLALQYPESLLEIVVFSDESSDRTDDIVRSYSDSGVRLERIIGRVGKTACQNRVAETVDSDIIVFSDANSMYEPDAIERLVEQFEDGVGCVVGELRYDGGGVEGESFYWRFERLLKQLESSFYTLIGANGAIYAVRRDSYVPLPTDAISDFAEPLEVIRNGETVRYAPDAVAHERTATTVDSELGRRVRIVTRSWNTFLSNVDLINPVRHPQVAFELLSHKVLRWLAPLSLGLAFVSNVMLVATTESPLYLLTFGLQVLFYAAAIAGGLLDRVGMSVPKLLHIPHYFVVSNYGMLKGLSSFLYQGTVVTWETEDRTGDDH